MPQGQTPFLALTPRMITRLLLKPINIKALTGGFNTTDADLDIAPTEFSNGQNIIPISQTSVGKRDGSNLYGNFLGTTTGILGGFNFVNNSGTQEQLAVYDTGVYRYVSGTWTALTSVTMTTNKQAAGAFYPITNKYYITNGTDAVVKYTSGTGGDQTDVDFKKGKYVIHFKNRLLVANVSGQEDYVWYTDLGVDTFSANNYFRVGKDITGIVEYYDKVLIFTKTKIFRLANFTFDGTGAYPSQLDPLATKFGAIYDRTIAVVNNFVYFLGQDTANKAAIYEANDLNANPISDLKIKRTMATVNTGQLTAACAVADANYYRLHVAETGQTTNTMGIIYDTVHKKFLTPERRFILGRADFSCLFVSETSGQWDVYAGTQGTGQVYKLHSNAGLYDELAEERYLTQGSYNVPIDANPAKRGAQSFKLSNYNATQTINITQISALLKKNAGTTTGLTVRIETDSSSKPSGTLVSAGATTTIAAFTDTSYVWKTAVFASAVALTGNTTYWLVIQHTTEGSGSSQYFWLADSCTATYANGNLATYQSAAWVSDATSDAAFMTYNQSAIDAYGDSAAFLMNDGKEFQLRRFQTIFSTTGSYTVEVSFDPGSFSAFQTFLIDLTSTGGSTYNAASATYDSGLVYDGNQTRNFTWTEVDNFIGRTLKQRIRNRNANQQFEYNQTELKITPRFREV